MARSYAYEFNESDVETIMTAIAIHTEQLKNAFIQRLEGKKGNGLKDVFSQEVAQDEQSSGNVPQV